MSEEYLEPGFDHKSLKVADLKRVLTENKISFPPAAKKAELRQIYNRSIVPMLPRLRSSSSAGGESSAGKDSDESASTSPESSASPPHKRLRDEMEDGEASDGSDAELRSNSTSISNARQISLSSSSEDDNMSSDNSLSNIVTKEPSTPVAKKRKTTSSTSGTPIVNRVKGKTQKYDNKHAPSATSLGLSTSSEDDSMSGISESDDEETSINVRKRGKENVGPKSFDFSVQSKSLAPDLTKMRVSSGFADQLKKAVESNSDMVSPSNSFAANATNESNSGVSAHDTLGIKLSGPPLKFDNLIEISDSSDDNGYDKIMEKFSSQSPPTENAKTNVPTPPVISEEDVRQAEERERALRESILSSESMEGEDQGDKLESVPPVEFGTAEGDPFDIPPVTEPAVVFESDYATHKEPTPEEPALGTSDHGDEREEVEVDVDNEYPANASIDHLDEPEIDLLNKEDNVEEEGIVLDDFDNSDAFHIQESGNIDSKTTHIDLEAKKQSSEETKKDNSEIREEISDTDVKKSPTQKKGRSIMLLVTKKVFRCVVLSATFIVGICAILFALWYREQVVLVGYCGFERRGPSIHDTYPNIDILKKVDDILEQHVPGCIPCPDNSICYPYMKLRCKAGYTLQKAQFGLFGLVPMSDSCVKDDRRDQLVREVVQKSLDFLRTKNAEIACGENKDNIISGISEKDLYNIFSEAKAPWIEDEEYEKIWLQVLQDLESEPEIIMRQLLDDGSNVPFHPDLDLSTDEIQGSERYIQQTNGTKENRYIRSVSKKYIGIRCRFEQEIRQKYYSYKYPIWIIISFVAIFNYLRYKLNQYFDEKVKVQEITEDILERLKRTTKEDVPYLSTVQLRDILLSDTVDLKTRNKIWEQVEKRLQANNTNIKSSLIEVHGEIMKCWQWVGPVDVKDSSKTLEKEVSSLTKP